MQNGLSKVINRILAFALSASFIAGFSACAVDDSEFPNLPQQEAVDSSNPNDETSETSAVELPEITVALPYKTSTVDYLSKLYYAKKNNLIGDSTGLDIDLNYLSSLNPDFVIHSVQVSNEGINSDTLNQWNTQNAIPDAFLVSDISSVVSTGYVSPVDEFLYDNQMISSNYIFANSINEQKIDGVLYGIPHYETVMLVVGNSDFIPESGKLANKYSTEDFTSYLSEIKKEYKDIIPLASGRNLLPYLGSSFSKDSKISYMLNKEYKNESLSYNSTMKSMTDYVQNLYDKNLTSNGLQDGADPVYSRRAAMWLASSSDISFWNSYYPGKLYFVQLPSYDVSNPGIPYTQVYSLCVSDKSEFKEFASEFASFISFDQDAVLLLNRLEPQTGFFPVVKYQNVWEQLQSDSLFGSYVPSYFQILDNSVYVPHSTDNKLYNAVNSFLSVYSGGEVEPEVIYGN